MSDWFETRAGLLERAWMILKDSVLDASHPARLVSFSTVAPDGMPESRNVVLRKANADDFICEVHTDIESSKIRSLRGNPNAALLWWIPSDDLQIRLRGAIEIVQGDQVDDDWEQVPASSRISYGTEPFPGTSIEDALGYTKPPVRDRFCVLRVRAEFIDLTYLGEDHRRASYTRACDWEGQWLSP